VARVLLILLMTYRHFWGFGPNEVGGVDVWCGTYVAYHAGPHAAARTSRRRFDWQVFAVRGGATVFYFGSDGL
jgi:hypothetical protein